ncbi:MAG: hypothetical protein H6837_13375 [Planctomycetes bacterium]|nr:hypothetical protein [Planctomycetota bacterium]
MLRRELDEVISEFSSNFGSHFDKVIHRLPVEASAGLNPAILVAARVVAYHETKWRELKVCMTTTRAKCCAGWRAPS